MNKIALLATGDELIQGDLLNTNGQQLAEILHAQGFAMGQHLVVGDDIDAIVSALTYLLTQHQIIIITGGLGPTEDDLTRFALANVLQRDLVLDEMSWDLIQQRIQLLGFEITENNQQQALFPENATIFVNHNATANACYCQHGSHKIFMLPGPPGECLPLFHQHILPILMAECARPTIYRHKWVLYKVSESVIANQVTTALADFPCGVGYRVRYPYLELKLACQTSADLAQIKALLWPLVQADVIGDGANFASELIKQAGMPLTIFDHATRGHLQAALVTPATSGFIHFIEENAHADIAIDGLDDYWQQTSSRYHLTLTIDQQKFTLDIPKRRTETMHAIIEAICVQIVRFFKFNAKNK